MVMIIFSKFFYFTAAEAKTIYCMAERVVGHGSFGIVFQDNCLESGETVPIKRIFKTEGTRTVSCGQCDFLTI